MWKGCNFLSMCVFVFVCKRQQTHKYPFLTKKKKIHWTQHNKRAAHATARTTTIRKIGIKMRTYNSNLVTHTQMICSVFWFVLNWMKLYKILNQNVFSFFVSLCLFFFFFKTNVYYCTVHNVAETHTQSEGIEMFDSLLAC